MKDFVFQSDSEPFLLASVLRRNDERKIAGCLVTELQFLLRNHEVGKYLFFMIYKPKKPWCFFSPP
jgi:hypothetical protein